MSEPQPTEEELRAAYEAELKKIRVEQVLLEHVVSLVNLGMRRTGLSPGTEDERDAEQVRISIDAIRALLPVLERVAPRQVTPIRDALSQLQLAFVRIGGGRGDSEPESRPGTGGAASAGGARGTASAGGAGSPGAEPPQPQPPKPGEPGPAQRSGKLWVPGQ
jgi:hypothetical protein